MEEFLKVLGFTALPALGNFGGGLLAEMFRISQKTLSLALHAAAGVILAVIGIELMPQALDTPEPWLTILAFVAGGIFFIFLDRMIDIVHGRLGNTEVDSGPWAIFAGVSGAGVRLTIELRTALSVSLGTVGRRWMPAVGGTDSHW
jgi:ZIP family zinc transporter